MMKASKKVLPILLTWEEQGENRYGDRMNKAGEAVERDRPSRQP